MMLSTDDFRQELQKRLKFAAESGLPSIEINSGELHRTLGDYPCPHHRMPACCNAMYTERQADDEIISRPPKGYGASLTIRYRLPR